MRNSLFIIVALLCTATVAEVQLEVNVASRQGALKRVIDFFAPSSSDMGTDMKALSPRYIVPYKGDAGDADAIKRFGCTPVLSLMDVTSRSAAKSFVAAGKSKGVVHYVIWTEPNRTWGGGDNNWLSTKTWESFLAHAAELTRGAKEADPNSKLSGPCITTDPRDTKWFEHLKSYLDYFLANNLKVEYVNIHPPYEPDQLYTASGLAKGYATRYPSLNIQGISSGEYPFFLNDPAVHVRFFLAFEECWNVTFAAKSNFRDTQYNSGIVTSGGSKKAVYHTYKCYSQMRGNVVTTTRGGTENKVRVLGSYDATPRTLYLLVGNDTKIDENVSFVLRGVNGTATAAIHTITSSGITKVKDVSLSATGGNMNFNMGTAKTLQAYYVTVQFAQNQTSLDPHSAIRKSDLRLHEETSARLGVDLSGRNVVRSTPATQYFIGGVSRSLLRLNR